MAEDPFTTLFLKKSPVTLPLSNAGGLEEFDADTQVLIQLLPSGTCIPVLIESVVVLGRKVPMMTDLLELHEASLDLTPYQAYQHGISRRHCLLRRRENHLVVMDLGGANGSYCNGERLTPFQEYIVSSGDELILGTLRLRITFVQAPLDAMDDPASEVE